MKICEIFVSHQGEVNVGKFALFIRMSGCNLNCGYCFGFRNYQGKIPNISLSNKGTKKIHKIKKGDKLLTLDKNHNLVETIVKNIIKREVEEWYILKINGINYYVTPEHPFFTTRGLIQTKDLKLGDEIFSIKGNEKLSFKMKKYNPMFNEISKQKSINNTDYKLNGKKISSTIKNKQKEGIYVSPWHKLSEEIKNKLRKLASERQIGNKNTNWKGGKKRNCNLLKKLCNENKLSICKRCKKENKLMVHHIDGNIDNDNLDNLTTICFSCHNKIHKRGYSFWKNNNRKDKKIMCDEKLNVMNDFLAIKHNGKKVQKIRYFNRNDKKYKYEYFKPKPLTVYNLSCEPYNTYLVDNMLVHNCDSLYAHTESFEMITDELLKKAIQFNRIVITGGEPFLQKEELGNFIERLIKKNPNIEIEIETNGTIRPVLIGKFKNIIYNVSLKLGNSNNDFDKRIIPSVIEWFNEMNSNFKFVINNSDDVEEANMIVDKFNINKKNVYLMPEGKTREEQLLKMEFVIRLAKFSGYNFSPRLHILIWDNERGV